MKQTGWAPQGVPVYSDDSAGDFAFRWLRCAWAEALSGLVLDASGDGAGYCICAVVELGHPLRSSEIQKGPTTSVHMSISTDLLVHWPNEDSRLHPTAAFELCPRKAVLTLEVDVVGASPDRRVTTVRVMPYSDSGVVARYGGRTAPYIRTW